MESIGQKLTTSREALGLTIEQIARETNIAKSYLTALEAEDFEAFPGETYLLGFLRNYSDFLNLDPEEMVNLYKNMKIQEQPAPIEELLDTRKPLSPVGIVVIIAVVVIALAAGFYFYIYPNYLQDRMSRPARVSEEVQASAPENAKTRNIRNTYEFTDEVIEKSFSKNDAVLVDVNNEKYQLYIADINEKAVFEYPRGEVTMSAGEELLLDLDGDSSADVRMLLRSLNASAGSLVLHIDRFVQSSVLSGPEPSAEDAVEESAAGTAVSGQAGAPSRVVDSVVIREAAAAEAFTLNIIFRGYCMLRYETDQGIREERYFHKGETFRLNADREVRLWVSNAGALSAKVNGVDITLGGPGEVSSRYISWSYNEDNSVYHLKLDPLY